MPKQVLCLGKCRQWFDAAFHYCPSCEWERPRWNGYLHRTKMDNVLYAQAESAERERKIEHAMRQGHDAPIPKHIAKAAKSLVKDM